jgi:hypothetical protein
MTSLLGPLLIFLGLTAFAYGIYLVVFANRDRRSARQKNLDSIAEIRGDRRPPNPAKKPQAAKSKVH